MSDPSGEPPPVFEERDGKIAARREYFDLATAAKIHEPGAA